MQQICGFDLTGVEAISALLVADLLKLCSGRSEERKRAQAKLSAQVTGHNIHERSIAAVRVVQDQLRESGGRDTRAKIAQHCGKCLRAQRESAGKAEMLVALSIADSRQREDGQLRRDALESLAQQQ